MARRFFTPLQDASIYEQFPARNTGVDEIVEIGKGRGVSGSIRGLIQFDVSQLSTVPLESTFFLNLRIAQATDFQRNQTIEFYVVSESWDEGTGFFEQDLENPKDGATWQIRNNADETWTFANGTASLGGSTGSLVATHSFSWEPDDIRLDVTTLVREWIVSGSFSGSTENGLLIKIPTTDEQNTKVASNIRFFSRNTHTVYPPTLEAVWNTQTMSVSSNCGLGEAPTEAEVFAFNMRSAFATGSTQRLRFGARNVLPLKTFADVSRFSNKYFFPSESYLGIQDAATKTFIVPFDSGSLLSADSTSSFFDLKIENMYVGRQYRVLLQVQKPWGPEIIDTGHTFKVV